MHLWSCLAPLAIILFATSAHADSAEADALIDHGVALREQGHDDLALQEFQKAYAIDPSARALAQIGLAEQALGIWRDAERDVGAALNATGDPWIEKNRSALEAATKTIELHLGTLEIRCDASDAELFVDGASRGKLTPGKSIRIESGTRNIEVRAPGRYASSRSVIVPPGGVARETIALALLPTTNSDEPHHDTHANGGENSLNREDDTGATQRNIGWVFLGTSAAFAIAGGVGVGARALEISSYNNDGSCPGLAAVGQPPLCQSKVDTAQTWTTVSILGFVGAGVLATGGTVLLLTAPRQHAGSHARSRAASHATSHATSADGDLPHRVPGTPRMDVSCGLALGLFCGGHF